MNTELQHVTPEFIMLGPGEHLGLQEVDRGYCAQLEDALKRYPDATEIVRYNCQLMDSSAFGRSFVLFVGPSNTLTELPKRGEKSKVVPREFQGGVAGQCFYPDGYCTTQELADALVRRKTLPEPQTGRVKR